MILIFLDRLFLEEEGKRIKLTTTVDALCKDHPVEFAMYINYCRGLRFEEKPDYVYLRRLFQGLFDRKRFERDNEWSC